MTIVPVFSPIREHTAHRWESGPATLTVVLVCECLSQCNHFATYLIVVVKDTNLIYIMALNAGLLRNESIGFPHGIFPRVPPPTVHDFGQVITTKTSLCLS